MKLTGDHVDPRIYRPRKFDKYRVPEPRNAYNPGGGLVYVRMGDLIIFNETYSDKSVSERIGRVLDQATRNGLGEPISKHFRVLVPAEDFHFGYIRIIDLVDIVGVRRPPFDFAMFLFRDELPDPNIIHAMGEYGSLSDSYIAADLKRRGL